MEDELKKMTIGALMRQGQVTKEPVCGLQSDIQDLLLKLEDYRISFLKEYPADQYMLELNDVGFFAKGDIHGIKAKQKSGKTSAIAIMTAALLSGECMSLRCSMVKPRILVFDTEQKPADTRRFYGNVFRLARMEERDMFDRLQVFSLRTLGMNEMLDCIRAKLSDYHPDIVFIDGLVDLLRNFNEVECSQDLLLELMRLSTQENCAIVGVLHTNKTMEDHNMRGHLGTILSQRSGTVLECQKKGDFFTVYCSDSRHEPVGEWSFMYRDGVLTDAAVIAREYQEAIEEAKKSKKEKAEEEKWNRIKTMIGNGIRKTDLARMIANSFFVHSDTAHKWINNYIDNGNARVAKDSSGAAFVYILYKSSTAVDSTQTNLPF